MIGVMNALFGKPTSDTPQLSFSARGEARRIPVDSPPGAQGTALDVPLTMTDPSTGSGIAMDFEMAFAGAGRVDVEIDLFMIGGPVADTELVHLATLETSRASRAAGEVSGSVTAA